MKSAPLNLSNGKIFQEMLKFGTKKKCLNLGPKMPFFIFGYFWARILKHYLKSVSQHPRICLIVKFLEKKKNALFRYFWARIFKKLLSYLEPTPSNLANRKFREKIKMSKFGTKNALFGCFWARTFKNYCHI